MKKWFKEKGLLVLLGLAVTAVMTALYIFQLTFLVHLDNKIYDTILRSTPRAPVSPAVAVVDLDEASLGKMGQWPWPRYRVALLLEKIRRLGAVAVGLDMIFTEPDRTSPVIIKEEIQRNLYVTVDFDGLPEGLSDYDRVLAGTLFNGPFVLGYNFNFDPKSPSNSGYLLHPLKVAWLKSSDACENIPIFEARKVACNLPVLTEAVEFSGFFNALPDLDGVLRRTPLMIKYGDRYFPSLGLATLMRAGEQDQILLKVNSAGAESIRLGDLRIPLGEKCTVLLNYRGPTRTYPYLPAWEIMEDRLPEGALEGMIIFVGTSAIGLRDSRTTPLDAVYPGVEVHATLVDNILSNDLVVRPEWAPGMELLALVLVGLISIVFLCRTKALWSLAFLGILAMGLWQGSIWIMSRQGIYLSPLMPLLTLGANFGALPLVKYWREERQKEFFRSAFRHYVSPAVVDELIAEPGKLVLGGEEKEVTVLFSDIRGFTTLSESLSPTQVSDLLHSYLTPMTRIITTHQGTLDKYIGDSIMAFWNAPLDIPLHQRQALTGALAMLAELKNINQGLRDKLGVELKIGLGLHSGTVRVGNMGSAEMFDYTVIGDTVNLANRLENLTKYYGLELLISETVQQACGREYHFFEVDRVRVKGRNEPVTIFTVLTEEEAARRSRELEKYGQGMALYKSRDWAAARELFAGLTEEFSHRILYGRYRDRCAQLLENPPGADWDGVFTHQKK